jgi:hypothetical protein
MREILFKGKTKMQVRTYNCGKKDNEWVYGHYYDKVGLPIIRQFELDRADYVEYEVDRETVGQYTGLKDKNGNRIFEGDIVNFDEKEWGYKRIEEVLFDYSYLCLREDDFSKFCEVIGNIHDNKNLIGE